MTKHIPTPDIDSVEDLIPILIELRDAALKSARMDAAVVLSHVIAHLNWIKTNNNIILAFPDMLRLLKELATHLDRGNYPENQLQYALALEVDELIALAGEEKEV